MGPEHVPGAPRAGSMVARGWSAVRPGLLALPPIFVLLLALAMFKHVDHDEHQFLASGALLARGGLLPYRDYPYFHLPNLSFVYAALDRASPRLLLNARLFNCACAALTLAVLFGLTFRWFERRRSGLGVLAGVVLVGAVMLNPVFEYTSGKAWNHDLPELLTLLAVLSLWHWRTAGGWRGVLAAALCGVLFGLAVGTRLTFAPVGAAFLACFLGTSRRTRRQKGVAVAVFLVAAALALAPSWALLAAAPRQFVFGNFEYPALNTQFRRAENYPRAMDLPGKVVYLFTDLLVQPGTLALFVISLASIGGLARPRTGAAAHPARFEAASLLLVCATLTAAAFPPTPLWLPYFFAPIPFAALFVARVAADERKTVAESIRAWRWLLVGACAAVPLGVAPYRHLAAVWRIGQWVPEQVHAAGVELARRCANSPPGPVLTYAPLIPLEGGCAIYPEFATGPFAARVADLVSEADEQTFGEVDADDLAALLTARPPAAVLTGFEGDLERPLRAFAEHDGYRRTDFPAPFMGDKAKDLWVGPERRTGVGRTRRGRSAATQLRPPDDVIGRPPVR